MDLQCQIFLTSCHVINVTKRDVALAFRERSGAGMHSRVYRCRGVAMLTVLRLCVPHWKHIRATVNSSRGY